MKQQTVKGIGIPDLELLFRINFVVMKSLYNVMFMDRVFFVSCISTNIRFYHDVIVFNFTGFTL